MLRYIIFAGTLDNSEAKFGWSSALRGEDGQVMSFNTVEEATEKLPKATGYNGYD